MAMALDDYSARILDPKLKAAVAAMPTVMVSADSHAQEPADIFNGLPEHIRDRIPKRRNRIPRPDGSASCDPLRRVADMNLDGVSAEILYPDHSLHLFGLDQDVQEAAFPIYNDWLADFCKAARKRLFGITAVSVYDIDKAIKEMQRGHDLALRGVTIWQVPDPRLPFNCGHYERFFAAAAEIGAPVHLHILTGHSYFKKRHAGLEQIRGAVNTKTADNVTTLFDILWSGVFDRYPKLKLALVESEVGWIPFILQQWDYYFDYYRKTDSLPITRKPSEIFREHCYCTFMDDFIGSRLFDVWGEGNIMWSSDYPHPNMTWPNSRAFVAKHIADLSPDKQKRLLSQNAIDLYGLEL